MSARPEPRPPIRAVALRHERGSTEAPRVLAKGEGEVAERILELARAHGIAVREDPELLRLLATCDPGEEIPLELYDAVARILAALYALELELAAEEASREAH